MTDSRRRQNWLVFAVLAASLAGCSGSNLSDFAFGKAPTAPVVDPNIFPTNYKAEIRDFLRRNLANPTKVKDAFIAEPTMKPVAGAPRQVTCVRYNPRDSKEQYEGPKTSMAIFLGGNLNQFLPGTPEICGGLAYQRFPEIESMVP